jgi:membrane protease subunit HflC
MRKTVIGIAVVLFGLFLARSTLFAVDRAEYVYLTQFGRHVATYDGETDAGLHAKWPWPIQGVQRVDHRLQVFDLPSAELLTHDPEGKTIDKTLTISAYACWRIAGKDGVDRFIRTVGSADRAQAILGSRINSRLGAEIGRRRLDELISEAPDSRTVERRVEALTRSLLKGNGAKSDDLQELAREQYGIELVDIRLRRFNYPSQVRDAIFARIRSERSKKVADYQSEGLQRSRAIRSQADYDERVILADARAKDERIRGEADAEADRIRNQAQGKDPAFYAFLKKLQEYQRILGDNKTVLLLSSHRELFDLLFKPPAPEPRSSLFRPGGTAMSANPKGAGK